MASINYIDKIKQKNSDDWYDIKAVSADVSTNALSANTAMVAEQVEKANKIGNNVSAYSVVDTKPREGLKFTNNGVEAVIDLNYKSKDGTGNLELEAKNGHVNIESSKGIQIKPTTTIIFDSSRRIENDKGNEINIEAKFDDYNDRTDPEYNGKKGSDEQWAELKIKSRNLDLRCHDHGGIALQIAGKDKTKFENKIKFESDRTNSISETGTYNGEGGKGLEFGTFNNLHSSLYTGDYRFRGEGRVYGVSREAPVYTSETGKWDYPTQLDDFKDPIDRGTLYATWNEIIGAANKCAGKEAVASIQDVAGMIAEASIPSYTGTTGHLATQEYVQNYVNEHGGGSSYEAGNGIHIEDNTISVNNYSSIEPLTALTNNTTALNCVKIGKDKGNFKIDVKGKYTYEANVDATDEYGNEVLKGGRVVNYSDEDFYNDPDKYYYKALVAGLTYEDETQNAQKGACAYKHEAFPSVSAGSYFYIAKKNAKMYPGDSSSQIMTKGDVIMQNGMTSEEISYYDGVTANTKWTKGYILKETDNEAFYSENSNWEKTALWITNEINVNLETDSKIKFDGAKIETTWDYPEIVGGDDVSHKMEEISLSTEDLVVDATQVSFESKVTKNGDFVDDTNIVYVFDNKLLDENGDAVIDVDTFRSNYRGKHPESELTDEEVNSLYGEYIAKGKTETISVRISDLLKLVSKVAELEARIETLEGNSVTE